MSIWHSSTLPRVIGVRAGEVVYDGPSANVDQAVLDKIYQGRQEMEA